jgi:hypothetical protein
MEVAANELSLGDTEYAMGETYGWTCYGTSSGDLNGFVFISMNYTVPEYQAPPIGDQIGVSPPQPLISMSKITGGSWTKLIFLRAVYLGSVHGRIGGGTIYWSTTNLSAKISMELMADGGTGSYVGSVGKGTFEGLLDHSAKGENISGVLTLSY